MEMDLTAPTKVGKNEVEGMRVKKEVRQEK